MRPAGFGKTDTMSQLADDTAVDSITESILSSGDLTGKIIVDTSTISPATTDSISTQLTSAGASFLACPAFGATPVAIQGRLLMAIAGPPSAIDIVKPYLEASLARSVITVGNDPIQATLLKTTGNFITAAFAETISEAHVFAEKTGLSPDILDDMIKQNYGEYAHSISQKLVTGVYLPLKGERPRSDLTLAIKDVRHGIEAAKEVDMTLDVAEVTLGHLFQAKRWGEKEGRALDSSAVYGVVRMESGLDFETDVVRKRDAGA